MEWQPISTAPNRVVVETKIDDGAGVRNIQTLKRDGNLWWYPDGSMYVYYRPTHWREEAKAPKGYGVNPDSVYHFDNLDSNGEPFKG